MSEFSSIFWQFDSSEFARMHKSEAEYRQAWIENKIDECNKKLAQPGLDPKLRLMILEDRVMYQQILKAMYLETQPITPLKAQ